MRYPTSLSSGQLKRVLNRVSPKGGEYAPLICIALADNPYSDTGHLRDQCQVKNPGDHIRKLINPQIADLGLCISSFKPPGSKRLLWAFFKAANDPDYSTKGKASPSPLKRL